MPRNNIHELCTNMLTLFHLGSSITVAIGMMGTCDASLSILNGFSLLGEQQSLLAASQGLDQPPRYRTVL